MTRVCHVITSLETGGAEHQLERIIASVPADHLVVSLRGIGRVGRRLEAAGAVVQALEISDWLALPRAVTELRRSIRAFRPDVVQGWMYHGNLAASAGVWPNRIPVCWNIRHSVHDLTDESPATRRAIRASVRFAGQPRSIVYNSETAAEQHEALGYPAQVRTVIPNGFDVQHLQMDAEKGRAFRAEAGIPADAPVVGQVARYHPMKNHAGFLRVALEIARKVPDVHFVLAGKGVDWSNSELAGVADTETLRNKTHLLGERSDLVDIYSALDVLCSPSAWGEAFPNVVGEAMSCGVACVVTDVGDSSSVVGSAGLTVPPGDEQALAEAVVDLLCDHDRRKTFALEARKRIASLYDLDMAVDAYDRLWGGVSTPGCRVA